MANQVLNKETQYFDSYLLGGLNSRGEIKEVYDIAAIQNALLMWLLSYRGDYVNNPQMGGYLIQHLTKPMSEYRTDLIYMALRNGIATDFFPALIVDKIRITPNFEQRYYQITIEGHVPEINKSFLMDENFRNF